MPNSSPVFLDTSGWIALLNADDQLHDQASERLRELSLAARLLVTTDWVLAETGNGLARVPARDKFVLAVETFLKSSNSQLVRIDADMFQRALQLYGKMADKTWGLVDCASFLIMRDAGIRDTLSADHHFLQAGFRCLLPVA